MASYSQQMKEIFERYQHEVSTEPVDLRIVGAWAMQQKLWAPRPVDVMTRFASEMADALREQYRTDGKGRRYRTKLAVKIGKQESLWGDIDTAPRQHVVKSVGQKRRAIVADCVALRLEADHYNDEHPIEDPLQLVLNFEDDVEEELLASGVESKKVS